MTAEERREGGLDEIILKAVDACNPHSDGERFCLYNIIETAVKAGRSAGLEAKFDELTDEERLRLVLRCCKGCGSRDVGCQCWNDE